MRRYPDATTLSRRLRSCLRHAAYWKGEAFRVTSVRYANRDDLLTGAGAKSNGGRWNPPASFPSVYASLTPETALAEYLSQRRYFAVPDSAAMPCVLAAIQVSLQAVLDLTDRAVRRSLKVSEAKLLDGAWRTEGSHESLTQAIGRAAFDAELEALVVPSAAARGGANLVVFPGNLLSEASSLRIVNREELPPPTSRGD